MVRIADSFVAKTSTADALRAKELARKIQMLARRRLTDPELVGDENTANPVLDEVALDLPGKMLHRLLEPLKDEEPPFAREGPKLLLHIDS
jgi:hypothetical protein